MRHVPIAEFKDRVSEIIAAVEAGDDVVITRHGRPTVRLLAVRDERHGRQRDAIEGLIALGDDIYRECGPTSAEEIRAWIDEGRR